jgi:hypothetical protein
LPEDGELPNILTVQCNDITSGETDKGPAPDQINPGKVVGATHSSVLLSDPEINISEEVNKLVKDIIGEIHGNVSVNKIVKDVFGEIHGNVSVNKIVKDVIGENHGKVSVNKIVKDVIGENHGKVSVNKKGTVTLPWPTRNNEPVSEFTTQYFFTLSFPAPVTFLLIDQGLLHL